MTALITIYRANLKLLMRSMPVFILRRNLFHSTYSIARPDAATIKVAKGIWQISSIAYLIEPISTLIRTPTSPGSIMGWLGSTGIIAPITNSTMNM